VAKSSGTLRQTFQLIFSLISRKIHNLISQRENRLARTTAGHIRGITKSLQADNAVMRCIAEDSKALALSSRHDGADMRLIAVVTLLFLPATFIAVSLGNS
jgi:hypothetical protein